MHSLQSRLQTDVTYKDIFLLIFSFQIENSILYFYEFIVVDGNYLKNLTFMINFYFWVFYIK